MVIVVNITDEEQLKREFDRILVLFKDLTQSEKPLQIQWGTKKAFEKIEETERGLTLPAWAVNHLKHTTKFVEEMAGHLYRTIEAIEKSQEGKEEKQE